MWRFCIFLFYSKISKEYARYKFVLLVSIKVLQYNKNTIPMCTKLYLRILFDTYYYVKYYHVYMYNISSIGKKAEDQAKADGIRMNTVF